MSKCCTQTYLEGDGRLQVRSCGDVCSDSDFLLKLFALVMVFLALILPFYIGASVFIKTMSADMINVVTNLFYSSAYGAVIVLIVLIVLVIIDEERHLISIYFLFIYSILLIAASVSILTFLSKEPEPAEEDSSTTTTTTAIPGKSKSDVYHRHNPEETQTKSSKGSMRSIQDGSVTKFLNSASSVHADTTGFNPKNIGVTPNLKVKRHVSYRHSTNDSKTELYKIKLKTLMNKIFLVRDSSRDDERTRKKAKKSTFCYLFSILLLIAGILMFLDMILEILVRI